MLRNNKPEGLLNAVRRYFRGIRMKTEHNGRKLSNSKYFFLCFFLSLFLSSFLPFFLMFFFSFLLLSFLLPSFFFPSFYLSLFCFEIFRNCCLYQTITTSHWWVNTRDLTEPNGTEDVRDEEHRPVGHQGSRAGIFLSIWCVFVDVAFDGNLAGRVPAHRGLTTLQSHARSVVLIAHTSDQKPPSVLPPIPHTSTTSSPSLQFNHISFIQFFIHS